MKVLVVDDDRTTRFLLRRALVAECGCEVTEARDGLEALDVLAKVRFHLVILDVQMPVLDGLETLRALRDAADIKATPVVMLTAERNESVVQQIIGLGVLDYMTKPLVPARIVERLRRVMRWIAAEGEPGLDPAAAVGRRHALEAGATGGVLIVDGDEGFRRFFAEVLGTRRPILQAETGARGFRTCLEANPAAVFIGTGLGVLNDAFLVRKIRSTPALRDSYLVAVVDAQEPATGRLAGYDGRIVRTSTPERLVEQIAALSAATEPLDDLLVIHPGLQATLLSAAEQVFGMMLSTEVVVRNAPELGPDERVALLAHGTWGEGYSLELRGACSTGAGRQIAGELLGVDPSMVDDADVNATVSELFNTIAGRFCSALEAKQIPMRFEQPAVSRASGREPAARKGGIAVWLQSVSYDLELWMMLVGRPRCRDAHLEEIAAGLKA